MADAISLGQVLPYVALKDTVLEGVVGERARYYSSQELDGVKSYAVLP